MKFDDFALRPEILQAVAEAGYETPTPIQQQAIPIILTGSDLLGIAQTGTGKTAAFVLPMIERLASGRARARMPRSLIVSPTRELATQTANYFATYGRHLNLTMALLIGGVGMDEQWRLLERGVDVLIATPGRLLDQFERGKVLLGGVTIMVIDEADRMLDMGFMPDVERIVSLVSHNRQTLMFSATMPPEIRRLADKFLSHPQEVQATPPATTAAGVEDHVTMVPAREKLKVLRRLIETQEVEKALIFCNRKREVASLRRQLERAGLNVRDIHGDLDQSQRTQALDAFKRGEIDFLVATDVAARGLDIVSLPCVINYDVPTHADDYVHRVRADRPGRSGGPRLHLGAARGAPLRRRDHQVDGQGNPAPRAARGRAGAAERAGAAAARRRAQRRPRPQRAGGAAAGCPEAGRAETECAEAVARCRRARATRRASPARAPGPVVGMGDHVPLFMRRPVPNAELLPKLNDD